MSALTPQQFVKDWQNTTLGERQSYQLHFVGLCQLMGHKPPDGTGVDAAGKTFAFEYGLKKDSGAQGFADVFYEGHFAIEYKGAGKYKDLKEAYQQLLLYREKLNNPPLLIVCDIQNWEIHTNWPNTEKKVYSFTNADIANRPSIQKWLRDIFEAPERLHPDRNSAQVTTDAAEVFHV
ncbi:MAG: class I SAM-dependent DNA methyltransferase, partial [Anaerolineae bacterium]|nr:class I SAM-dependent DNA methyltransferase [Anaerolineae bacterium]